MFHAVGLLLQMSDINTIQAQPGPLKLIMRHTLRKRLPAAI